jgi:hypothetical protein
MSIHSGKAGRAASGVAFGNKAHVSSSINRELMSIKCEKFVHKA